jgi:hypothetical protein
MTHYTIKRTIYCPKESEDVSVSMNCKYCEHCRKYDLRKNIVGCDIENAVFPKRDANERSNYVVKVSLTFDVGDVTEDEIRKQMEDVMHRLSCVGNTNWKVKDVHGKTRREEE